MFMHYKKGKSFFYQLTTLLMVNHDSLCLCEATINGLDALSQFKKTKKKPHQNQLKTIKTPPTPKFYFDVSYSAVIFFHVCGT